jgi:hypothetical protein
MTTDTRSARGCSDVANPPRQKGTRFETAVVNRGLDYGLNIRRMPPGCRYDIHVWGSTGRTIEALAAKQNYGPALVTIPLDDFFHLLKEHGDAAHIECKSLKKIALHSIYQDKFRR